MSRLFGLFRKKPVAPVPAPAPVVAVKPEAARERTDRNGRSNGQRGRTRGGRAGRERDEREAGKPEGLRDEAVAKQAASAALPASQPARPPRPPREPREGAEGRREPREAREPREGVETKRERAPRAPREDRKAAGATDVADVAAVASIENAAAVLPSDEALPVPASVQSPVPPAIATAQAAGEVPQETIAALAAETGAEQEGLENPVGEVGEDGDDQPRRRRRRGGRNRNRRDRENGELGENGEELEAGAAIGEAQSSAEATPESTLIAVQTVDVAPSYATVDVPAADTFTPATPASVSAAPVQEAAEMLAPASTAETVAIGAAPDVEAPAAESAPVQAGRFEEPASAQEGHAEPAVTLAATPQTQSQAPAMQDAIAVEARAADATPAVQAGAGDAQAGGGASPLEGQPKLQQPQAAAAGTQKADGVMPMQELNTMLGAAGLTLASTDPEKLRAAQEAAARILPAPRVPRERKPLPPVPDEPLIQVETNR